MKKTVLLIAVIIGVSSINAKTKLTSKNINQVISAMTLEEKASLLVGYTKGYNPHGKATAKKVTQILMYQGFRHDAWK